MRRGPYRDVVARQTGALAIAESERRLNGASGATAMLMSRIADWHAGSGTYWVGYCGEL